MRSYYAHLETTTTRVVAQKPVFRSSAIFPMMQKEGITCRILFMGYWILKRSLQEIASVITLRDKKGNSLNRDFLMITDPKTYRIELKEQLQLAGLDPNDPFEGSLEIEFFSTQNLVFPYPAVAINYYGPQFSSLVHSAQRVYNDFEDRHRNSETSVPESGFNIHADRGREPVIGLINGPEPVENQKLELSIFNTKEEKLDLVFPIERLAAYETLWLYPGRITDLHAFLNGQAGTAKMHFHVNWIFPRLLVGNLQTSPPGFVITHSYYDTTNAVSDKDYWLPVQEGWHQASLMLPINFSHGHNTSVYFYPIYSPSHFAIDLEIYDRNGKKLKSFPQVLTLGEGVFQRLDMQKLCADLPHHDFLAIRLLAHSIGNSRLPARIKLAIDIGNPEKALPCNICTNLQPFVPAWEKKPSTFRWGPVIADHHHASVWILNSSPQEPFLKEAKVKVSFYREKDTNTFARDLVIPPNGFALIQLDQDTELQDFFAHSVGWYTLVSDNPYTNSFYFVESDSGIVGGDHSF